VVLGTSTSVFVNGSFRRTVTFEFWSTGRDFAALSHPRCDASSPPELRTSERDLIACLEVSVSWGLGWQSQLLQFAK
jgi:hypothetical protein